MPRWQTKTARRSRRHSPPDGALCPLRLYARHRSGFAGQSNGAGRGGGLFGDAGSISGAGTIYTFDTLIDLGVATDFNIGLYIAVYPGWDGGSNISADFSHTLRLSGIRAIGSDGSVLDTAIAGRGSSRYIYDSYGSHAAAGAVPDPAA